jgi:deoxyribodipyrimidine photolyase-related protein
VQAHAAERIRLLEPNSLGARRQLGALPSVELVRGTLFLTHPDDFRAWVTGRRRIVMEDFYRGQRRRLGLLMEGDNPAGRRWNFERDNRERPPRDAHPPLPFRPAEDTIDDDVRRDLDEMALETFGRDSPRLWSATRAEARESLECFVATRLPDFGRWRTRCSTASASSFGWFSTPSSTGMSG